MVNLQALEAAVTKVEKIRDLEFCFEIDGTKICMMPLRSEQETEVQKFAQVAMEDLEGEPNQAAFADFMDRMRQASLGFSIVQIGALNLRDSEYVETGDLDDFGNPVSVPKWEAVANLISKQWSRMMLSQVFGKFGEMLDRVELRAQKAVRFDAVDLDEEIQRTERRLDELRKAKARIKPPTADQVTRQQKKAVEMGREAEERHNNIRDGVAAQPPPQQTAPEPQPEPQPAPAPEPQAAPPQQPQGRVSAVPQNVPARERPPAQAPPQAPQQPQAAQPQQAQQAPQQPQMELDNQGIPLPDEGDSFFDPSDPEQAVAMENRRQLLLHQKHLARQQQQKEQARMRQEMGMPSPEEQARQMAENQRRNNLPNAVDLSKPVGPAAASVRQAANLHNAVVDAQGQQVVPGRPQRARPQAPVQGSNTPAQLHGKPVYKMPAQTLDRPQAQRQHGEAAPGPLQMNPSSGNRNPNFRGKGS